MMTMMSYLIQVNVVLSMLYLVYVVLLGRDTFFGWRRGMLLGILGVAVCAPLPFVEPLVESLPASGQVGAWTGQIALPEVVVTDHEAGAVGMWPGALYLIYMAGVIVLMGRIVGQVAALARLRRRCPAICMEGQRVHVLEEGEAPFSFFGQIYLCPTGHTAEEVKTILAHESAHVRQGHSVDVVLTQVACALCWFNPVVWMYAREVRRNLEYLADDAVIRRGVGRKAYQLQLLEMTLTSAAANLYNHFNVLPLKTRIRMMNKKRTNGMGRVKYLLMIPAAALLAAACQNKESKGNEMEELTVVGYAGTDSAAQKDVVAVENPVGTSTEKAAGETPLGEVYDMVEQAPTFPGGNQELMSYLAKNIKYPKEAQAAKKEGRVIVQFVVASTGQVTNVKVMRGVDPLLDAEAIRVVEGMPRWTPGRQDGEAVNVRYTLPVTFRLS